MGVFVEMVFFFFRCVCCASVFVVWMSLLCGCICFEDFFFVVIFVVSVCLLYGCVCCVGWFLERMFLMCVSVCCTGILFFLVCTL